MPTGGNLRAGGTNSHYLGRPGTEGMGRQDTIEKRSRVRQGLWKNGVKRGGTGKAEQDVARGKFVGGGSTCRLSGY